jgi:hypothetical protein
MSISADEFLYEYKGICDSDAMPPEVGTLLSLSEFAEEEADEVDAEKNLVPYRIIEFNRQPRKTLGNDGNVSTQMRVHLTFQKGT